MDGTTLGTGFAIGVAVGGIGGLVAALLARGRAAATTARFEETTKRADALLAELGAARAEAAAHQQEVGRLREAQAKLLADLDAERRAGQERLAAYEQAETKMREAFEALSRQALDRNAESFLNLAKTHLGEFQQGARTDLEARQTAIVELMKPVRDSLEKVDANLRRVEGNHSTLAERLLALAQSEEKLKSETANLAMALRAPGVRGRWGELQLRRVVELAGMLDHCDFDEQVSADGEEGRLRPDLVVRLPGGRNIVVDAKAVVRAYVDAEQAGDESARAALMSEHARLVREHMGRLSAKSYWEQFQPAPEFVVMFLPGENFFRAALHADPDLIDRGVGQRVVLASPINLIALLWGAAQGWQEQRMAAAAAEISENGREIYRRLSTLATHFDKLRQRIDGAVVAYNEVAGSFENRLLPMARRFRELGVTADEVPALALIERAPRGFQSTELQETPSDAPEIDDGAALTAVARRD
jgi:DNA recombination protein RmuC